MPINEFEWPQRRICYEWTNLNDDWRIPLLIVSNWLAQSAIWSLSCWFWTTKDEFEFWFFTAITFRAKLITRNVKLIGESLKLTGKTYIILISIIITIIIIIIISVNEENAYLLSAHSIYGLWRYCPGLAMPDYHWRIWQNKILSWG